MNNKDLEKKIAEALLSGEAQLIPASELGYDDSQFSVDTEQWFDTMYNLYKDSCHFENVLDPLQTSETYANPESVDSVKLTCRGKFGFFRWYSLSIYFDLHLHKLNDDIRKYNSQHSSSVTDTWFDSPGEHLSQAINNEQDLVNLLRDPIVVNMSCAQDEFDFELDSLEKHLRNFLGIDIIPKQDVIIRNENNETSISANTVYQKDVIIPGIYATTATLEKFGKFAKQIIENGANTVIGLFITRLIPTLDGREGIIPNDQRVGSFAPNFRIRLSDLV